MKRMNRELIEYIDSLDRESIEHFITKQKTLPLSADNILSIGYALLKVDRLNEAFSFFEKLYGSDWIKYKVLLTGYRKGLDGDWHSYDDSWGCGGSGGNDNNNGCGGCIVCLGGIGCTYWCASGGCNDFAECFLESLCNFCLCS